MIHSSSVRLKKEVEAQRALLDNDMSEYVPDISTFTISAVFQELGDFYRKHPKTTGKNLKFEMKCDDLVVQSDASLIVRVLCNMITNALEASEPGQTVRIWAELTAEGIMFGVWNHQPVPEAIRLRIFQRNYSTKSGLGRGLGAYSMKLFGEKILGGRIDFITSEEDGTTFHFVLPKKILLDKNRQS